MPDQPRYTADDVTEEHIDKVVESVGWHPDEWDGVVPKELLAAAWNAMPVDERKVSVSRETLSTLTELAAKAISRGVCITQQLADARNEAVGVLYDNRTPTQERSMSEHTPGPWTTEDDHDGLLIGPDDTCVCVVERYEGHQANARLIAAAPDLLAAALTARDSIVAQYNWRAFEVNFSDLAAAIAKATTN